MEPDAEIHSCTYHATLFIPLFFSVESAISTGIVIALVLVLLLCSALVSSSEVAFFSLTPKDLFELRTENSPAAQRILGLKAMPRRLLATILISNNFINIAIVILSDFILRRAMPVSMVEKWVVGVSQWPLFSFTSTSAMAIALHFAITIVGVTFLLVLFGEVAPKVYAKLNNVRLAKFMASPLQVMLRLFLPVSNLLVKGTGLIEGRLQKKSSQNGSSSKEEINQAIDLTVRKDDSLAGQETSILKNIVKFGEVSVKQIMRSRVDVVAVDFKTSFKELLRVIKSSGYSRIPVYQEDFDNITGILYVKDLLDYLNEDANFEWQALIRADVLYVPEAKKIDDLLREIQTRRLHMAIVVDEYGGCSGIVTLEDIMEEVIGDIKDEFDDERELDFQKIDDYNYIFEGKTLLHDVCRVVKIKTDTFDSFKGDADTVAGLLLELIGYIPKQNMVVDINNFRFTVTSVSRRRIEQIKITLPKKIAKTVE